MAQDNSSSSRVAQRRQKVGRLCIGETHRFSRELGLHRKPLNIYSLKIRQLNIVLESFSNSQTFICEYNLPAWPSAYNNGAAFWILVLSFLRTFPSGTGICLLRPWFSFKHITSHASFTCLRMCLLFWEEVHSISSAPQRDGCTLYKTLHEGRQKAALSWNKPIK